MATATGDIETTVKHLHISEKLFADTINPTFFGELTCGYGLLGLEEDAARALRRLKEMAETRRIPPITWDVAYAASVTRTPRCTG